MAPRQRERLDRATIVRTALDLLDEVGVDALSTRALAGRLGVKSPALYWHFDTKQQLLDAMAEAMLDDAPGPDLPGSGDDPLAWMAARAREFRRALLSRRDGARVHAGTRPPPRNLRMIEAQVAALCGIGLPAADAARGVLAVFRYTLGWVLEEQSTRPRSDGTGWDLDAFPSLQRAAHVFEQRDPDRDFEFGLAALISGLSGRPGRSTGSPRSTPRPDN